MKRVFVCVCLYVHVCIFCVFPTIRQDVQLHKSAAQLTVPAGLYMCRMFREERKWLFSYKASDKAKSSTRFPLAQRDIHDGLSTWLQGLSPRSYVVAEAPVWLQLLVYESLNSPSEPRLSCENDFFFF